MKSELPAAENSESRHPGNSSRSIRRVVSVLDLLLRRDEPASVAEIARSLSIPRSTAYGIVNGLAEARYVDRRGDGSCYFLGPKLFELGMAYSSKIDLLTEGATIVKKLRDDTGETVQLSVLESDMLLVLMKEEGSRPVRIISRVGSRVPVNWAAGGRLIVSDLGEDELRRLLRSTVRPSPTGKASTDVDFLVRQVRRFRQRGYSIEIGETNEHAGCVAAPVFDASGRCTAAMSIAAPEQRLKAGRKQLIQAACAAARQLSYRLGAPSWDGGLRQSGLPNSRCARWTDAKFVRRSSS
jgi:DNA-binding IclR family transcriptional regulator